MRTNVIAKQLFLHYQETQLKSLGLYLLFLGVVLIFAWPSSNLQSYMATSSVPGVAYVISVSITLAGVILVLGAATTKEEAAITPMREWIALGNIKPFSILWGTLLFSILYTLFLLVVTLPILYLSLGLVLKPFSTFALSSLGLYCILLMFHAVGLSINILLEEYPLFRVTGIWLFSIFYFILTFSFFPLLNPANFMYNIIRETYSGIAQALLFMMAVILLFLLAAYGRLLYLKQLTKGES